MKYDVKNWYWKTPDDLIYSSYVNALVDADDATYQAWLSAGGIPTAIDSIQSALAVVIDQTGVLSDSDTTMLRITEAVSLGRNEWTSTDVVNFIDWRRALRNIINGTDMTSTSIPARPSYPAGT